MNSMNPESQREAHATTRWVVSIFILAGALLIALSLFLPHEGKSGYLRELLKELGIVVLAVFTISLVYELTVAGKYLNHFMALLREQVQKGESNAATCAHLGIERIYPTRDVFEIKHPFSELVSALLAGASLRIVARSMFVVMTKPEAIKKALEQGSSVELCLLDPNSTPSEIAKTPGLEAGDIQTAMTIFRKYIADWIKATKPQGQISLRYHSIPLLDSFLLLTSSAQQFCVWDLSFGRDLASKRIFLLDPKKPFGMDLSSRYQHVWEQAERVFEYNGKEITIDKLSISTPASSA